MHRIPDKGWIELPQSFLKLDPEVGMASARVEDLQAHVTINDDDERHPATERFGLFRGLVGSTSQRFTQLR